jgi:hypothetical protein
MIIIVVPPYMEQSNGIKSLHWICHTMNGVGYDARLVFLHNGVIRCGGLGWTNLGWNTPCLAENDFGLVKSEVVVYPEIVSGNPLGALRVARYLGNKEGLLTGKKMEASEHDFILAHSKVIEPKADYVLFNVEVNKCFDFDEAMPRNMDLMYVGKGVLYKECDVVKNTFLIGRNWPQGAEQLAYLLKRAKIFYTWDSWTQTNVEAILCGAIPYFMMYEPWTEAEIDGTELGKLPRMDVNKKNYVVFNDERIRLKERINELNKTWPERVKVFGEKVLRHFV